MQHLPQELKDHVQLCYKSQIRDNAKKIYVMLDHIGVLSSDSADFQYTIQMGFQGMHKLPPVNARFAMQELVNARFAMQELVNARFAMHGELVNAWFAMRRELLNFANSDADVPLNQLMREIMALQKHDAKFKALKSSDALNTVRWVLKRLPVLLQGRVKKLTHDELCEMTTEEVRKFVYEIFV
jgi:hypothetical protein